MSDIKNLLEKMDAMSAAERKPTGPKWPGYLKGTDSAKKSRSRMVGDGGTSESVEESENFLKELDRVINENPVQRNLFQEWTEFKEGFNDTVRSTADKIVAAGTATKDALGSIIPRPFDEKEVAKDINQSQTAQTAPKTDWRNTGKKGQTTGNNEGKETPTADNKDLKSKKSSSGSGVTTDSPSKYPTKTDIPKRELPKNTSAVIGEQETIKVQMQSPSGVPKSALDYNDPDVQFFHKYKDGREKEVTKGSPDYNEYWRKVTGREDPITQELIRGIQNPREPGTEYKVSDSDNVQDIKIPGQDKGRHQNPLPNWKETDPTISEWSAVGLVNDKDIIAEFGAPGSGIGNDTATNPQEVFQKGQQAKATKEQTAGQIAGLVAQITGLRRQLADLNKQFPQGANPVEKAMSLQQMSGQRNGIKSQIVDLAKQISQLRQQA